MPALTDINVDFVSLVDRAAVRDSTDKSEPQRLLLWKREGIDDHPPTEGGAMPSATDVDESVQARLDKAEEEKTEAIERAEAAEAELAKAGNQEGEDGGPYKKAKGGDDADGDEQTARKGEDSDLQAQLAKAESDRQALADRLAKAEADTAAERNARVTKEYIAKAAEFESLPIEAPDFGPVLKAVDEKLTKEEAEAIHSLLKAADEIAKESALFKELGKGGVPAAGDALAKLQAKAADIRKADPSLSADAALQKAMEDNRELQQQYLDEVR